MERTFDPAAVEGRISALWEDAGAFRAGRPERLGAEPFTIVIPPPNVTGSLHMGHALNNTLQDILCRFERMRGRDVLWQPGTDHAGIATQMVVERQLMERQAPNRRDMGREKFLEEVWRWKEESGGAIINQLKRLGASCDWSRERFTMDEGLSKAVVKVFVQLYKEGLIYKDKRLVNWDPKLQTAISDLEAIQKEHKGSFSWSCDSEEPLNIEALSKVLSRDPNGHLYYIKYPILRRPDRYIIVATTRPETMLGDMAVAVPPGDERYADLVAAGDEVELPLVLNGRPIPIIEDAYSDPEKGTGAVKITPAHDFNDFDVWKRHPEVYERFEEVNQRNPEDLIDLFTSDGRLKSAFSDDLPTRPRARWPLPEYLKESRVSLDNLLRSESTAAMIPESLRGLDRFEARLKIVEMLYDGKLLIKIEPHFQTVPHGDRSDSVVEPRLTEQWYVDAKVLVQPALAAVREGKTKFVPENWQKTYFQWLDNIQPWCISRQLWWGHRIPAWYGPDGEIFVENSLEAAVSAAIEHYEGIETVQIPVGPSGAEVAAAIRDGRCNLEEGHDEDVLDTWFSSALWPFSTLGWPDETPEVKRYYPTNVLVTGFDIIFFWVARMMMMGLHFMQEIPFHDVYIHALVRDEKGAKMSKSKGNVIDPLGLIEQYGADALRFTLAAMAAQGRDIKLSTQRVEGYRNFATKLWNAARFAELNGCALIESFDPRGLKVTLNQWILGEAEKAVAETSAAIMAYRFNDAANAAYRFVWNIFCDWYLELAKPLLQGADEAAKAETRAATAFVLDTILKLLHPFMPFITEELWGLTAGEGNARKTVLALAEWPMLDGCENPQAEAEIGWVVELISELRSVRSEMNVPAGALVPLVLVAAAPQVEARAGAWGETIKRLGRASGVSFAAQAPEQSVQVIVRGTVAALPLQGVIDFAAEKVRLSKEIEKLKGEAKKIEAKLANAEFVAKAPEDVVEENRDRLAEIAARIEKLSAALARLGL